MSSEDVSLPFEVQRSVVHKSIRYKDFLGSHLREGFETLRKAVPVTYLFLFYMVPLSPVSKGKTGEDGTGKPDYRNLNGLRISNSP